MKNKSLLLFLAAAAIISSCKKDELINPETKLENIKPSDKGLMCNCGGATWDLSGSDFSIESNTTDSSPGTDTAFVNSKRFKDGAPVLPTKRKEK
jgi:hypothetical protein